VITALGGALLLGETITLRLTLASLAVLGGIALVVRAQPRRGGPRFEGQPARCSQIVQTPDAGARREPRPVSIECSSRLTDIGQKVAAS
jgi:hypothetical protein